MACVLHEAGYLQGHVLEELWGKEKGAERLKTVLGRREPWLGKHGQC